MADNRNEPPFEGGSQPVKEEPTGANTAGRGVGQTVVLIVGVLVVVAGLLWILVPFGAD